MRALMVLIGFACDLVTPAGRGAPPTFTLEARALDARTVEVRGTGLERGRAVTVSVDVAMPHASIACARAFRRSARTDADGVLRVRIVSRDPDCDFTCDGERTALEVVLDFAGGGLAGTGPFPCLRNR